MAEPTSTIIKILIDAFAEDCIAEIKKSKHPNEGDMFNFGLASAESSIKRIKQQYEERLNNAIKKL